VGGDDGLRDRCAGESICLDLNGVGSGVQGFDDGLGAAAIRGELRADLLGFAGEREVTAEGENGEERSRSHGGHCYN